MGASANVWAVELASDVPPDEVRGTLTLEDDALLFTPRNERLPAVRIPFERIEKVRRVRGSPILMVHRSAPEGPRRTAFYFAQPPPLAPLLGEPVERPSGLAAFRSASRKARRDNVGYLGLMNREKKAAVDAWVRAVRSAMRGGRPGSATAEG